MGIHAIDASASPAKVKAVDITTGQQETYKDSTGKDTQWVEIANTSALYDYQAQRVVIDYAIGVLR